MLAEVEDGVFWGGGFGGFNHSALLQILRVEVCGAADRALRVIVKRSAIFLSKEFLEFLETIKKGVQNIYSFLGA